MILRYARTIGQYQILSFVSNALERVVAIQLSVHLRVNNLEEPFQSAYRPGHSTETAMVKIHNDIITSLGEKKAVLLVMLDLSAAFDTVSYDCLLSILQELGMKSTVLQWFETLISKAGSLTRKNFSPECLRVRPSDR